MYSVKFSVVIPLYNKQDYITRAIDSVLAQTFTEFECLVIDDGSTDTSLSIVQKYDDPRIKLISKVNGGVSQARNAGIFAANYEYIAFLDADDHWTENYLASMAQLIHTRPGSALYFSSHYICFPDGTRSLKESPELACRGDSAVFDLFEYFQKYRIYGWTLHTSCCIVDKNTVIEVGGFDERISYYEDYDLFSRIALKTDFTYLNKPLTFYNHDIPAGLRLTGKLPSIDKHWANYILFGPLAALSDSVFTFFTHNFAVYLLHQYRMSSQNSLRVAEIRKQVKISRLSAKSIMLHILPIFLILFLFRVKRLITATRINRFSNTE